MKDAFSYVQSGARDCGGVCTVYKLDANVYTPYVVYTIKKARFGHSYSSRRTLQLEYTSSVPAKSLSTNSIYYMTFGGLF